MDTDTLKNPEYCASCDEYYAYRDGFCWGCWTKLACDSQEVEQTETGDQNE